MPALRPVVLAPERRLGPLQRLALIAEILWTYQRSRRLMRSADLPTALGRLRGAEPPVVSGTGPTPQEVYLGQRVGRAVMMVLAKLPTDKRCLVRSLVVSALVARRGVAAVLTIGVRPDANDPFLAHAWVEIGDTAVIPDEGYAPLHSL